MTVSQYLTIPLTGSQIPIIGFGSGTKWQHKKKDEKGGFDKSREVIDEDLVTALSNALKHGFVHLDTAEAYTTRRDIGEAIKRSGVSRDKIWITDKYLTNSNEPKEDHRGPYESLKEALDFMSVDYIDLFLFHAEPLHKKFTLEQAWREMEKLYKEGLVKNIGVSNYTVKKLEEIKSFAEIQPAVNQIEFHPYLQNQSTGILQYARQNDILIEAYAPLSPITRVPGGPLDEVLNKLATKYGKNESQILLKWVHKQEFVSITTTSSEKRLDEVLDVLNFDITDEDVKLISDVGNTHFYRGFNIPPLPEYNQELKKERGLTGNE